MAGRGSPTHSPPAKSPTTSNPTYMDRIGGDILREIFFRLPSIGTLVKAACTCRAWRDAVVSSPKFHRQFRNLHPAPLLGLFIQVPNRARAPTSLSFPTFIPVDQRGRELVAIVRHGDFSLTSIQERPDVSPSWTIIDSRHGYVLLMNRDDGSLTVFNPLLWWSKTFGLCKEESIHRVKHTRAQLVCSDEDPMSFCVVLLFHNSSRVRATVFSSKTMEWSILPWMEVPARLANGPKWRVIISGSMQANRFMYWVCTNNGIPLQDPPFMIALDKTTMEISFAELPLCLDDEHCSFHIGEMKDTSPCIIYASDLNIGVLMRATEGGGAQSWYLQKVSNMYTQLTKLLGDNPPVEVDVVAVMDGFAYLAVETSNGTPNFCWILSLCLETMELDKLFQVAPFNGGVYPYIMTWPPALVGNYGAFALGHAP